MANQAGTSAGASNSNFNFTLFNTLLQLTEELVDACAVVGKKDLDDLLTLLKSSQMITSKLQKIWEILNHSKVCALQSLRELVAIAGDFEILQSYQTGNDKEKKEYSDDEKLAADKFKTSFKKFSEIKLTYKKSWVVAGKALAEIKSSWNFLDNSDQFELKKHSSYTAFKIGLLKGLSKADELIQALEHENEKAKNLASSINKMIKNFKKSLNEHHEFENRLLAMETKFANQALPDHQA